VADILDPPKVGVSGCEIDAALGGGGISEPSIQAEGRADGRPTLPEGRAAPAADAAAVPAEAPACPYCGQLARLVTGETIYPQRLDLAQKYFWQCVPCDAYVGTHAGTQRPLGTPANAELRRARTILHDRMLDPLWKLAPECGAYNYAQGDASARKQIQRSARLRVYAFLSHKLGLPIDETHTGMFTIELCRAAWTALKGATYVEIRDWYKQRLDAAGAKHRKHAVEQAPPGPPRPPGPSRNRPCPCGSGLNFKRCCAPDAMAKHAAVGVAIKADEDADRVATS
jgi:hypothetical protein